MGEKMEAMGRSIKLPRALMAQLEQRFVVAKSE
jgi:hypothetical protein